MKALREATIISSCLLITLCIMYATVFIYSIDYNINRATDYILSTQEIVSGQHDELKELRDITDEFRAQIKGLQKEVFVGVQKEGL